MSNLLNVQSDDPQWKEFRARMTAFSQAQLLANTDKEYFEVGGKNLIRSNSLTTKQYHLFKKREFDLKFRQVPADQDIVAHMEKFQNDLADFYYDKCIALLSPALSREEYDDMPFHALREIIDTVFWEQENGRPLSGKT